MHFSVSCGGVVIDSSLRSAIFFRSTKIDKKNTFNFMFSHCRWGWHLLVACQIELSKALTVETFRHQDQSMTVVFFMLNVHTSIWEKPYNWKIHQNLRFHVSHWIPPTPNTSPHFDCLSCCMSKGAEEKSLNILGNSRNFLKWQKVVKHHPFLVIVSDVENNKKKYWLLFVFGVRVSTLIDFTCHGIFK